MEIWKEIEGYAGLYEISNWGNIRSLKFGRKLNPVVNSSGYKLISLSKEGKGKSFSVHRLVAEAFIPNSNNYPCINHKDENKTNNHVSNLEWCTQKYNCNYGNYSKKLSEAMKTSDVMKNKKLSEKHKKNISKSIRGDKNPRSRKILCVTTGEMFSYIDEVKEKYNIKTAGISACCRGVRKSAGKHPVTGDKMVWEYVD